MKAIRGAGVRQDIPRELYLWTAVFRFELSASPAPILSQLKPFRTALQVPKGLPCGTEHVLPGGGGGLSPSKFVSGDINSV